jgi:hypothetical protein
MADSWISRTSAYVSRGRRRLGDDRHARQQRRRQFLQQSPARKVEGVDVNRNALQRRQDMLADKTAGLGKIFHIALDREFCIGQIAAAARGVGRQCADAAVDIDHIVAPVGASVAGQSVERFLAFGQIGGQCAQHVGALVKCQLTQRGSTDLARVSGHRREIQPRARCAGNDAAIHRARNIGISAGRLDPAIKGKALQGDGHEILPVFSSVVMTRFDGRHGR